MVKSREEGQAESMRDKKEERGGQPPSERSTWKPAAVRRQHEEWRRSFPFTAEPQGVRHHPFVSFYTVGKKTG
jgi:hypothetical protein